MATQEHTYFISHSHEDLDFAVRLATDLKAAGAKVWLDKLDIKFGEWGEQIAEALRECDFMLVIWSPAAAHSKQVRAEFGDAFDKDKILIPVLYREYELDYRLKVNEFADFRTDYNEALKKLVGSIGRKQNTTPIGGGGAPTSPEAAHSEGSSSNKLSSATMKKIRAKRIVFCADGTWDTPANHTNVFRFSTAVAGGVDQIVFYDEGVGTNGVPITSLKGSALGMGLWNNIKRGYSKIAQVYQKGNDLYLLGFSRGAYIARSVAGMICIAGLPTQKFTDEVVDMAFSAYREVYNRKTWLANLKNYNMYVPDIKMVGVWDTVGALGIPAIHAGPEPILYGFLSNSLSPRIENFYHALAIDERRVQFQPTLGISAPLPGQIVEQVWFSGCHSDVGGAGTELGLDNPSLSDITLGWMMSRAGALGLKFDPAVLDKFKLPMKQEYSLGKLHDSWSGSYGAPTARLISEDATMANSVSVRCNYDSWYRPRSLKYTKTGLYKKYPLAVVVNERS